MLTRPIRQATAQEVVKFLEKSIFLVFGVPETIVTDNGKQFESKLLEQLLLKYGVRHIFTAKYSPQGNASERVNRTLLASLRAYIKKESPSMGSAPRCCYSCLAKLCTWINSVPTLLFSVWSPSYYAWFCLPFVKRCL